jgi:activator of HSP90 ATPase
MSAEAKNGAKPIIKSDPMKTKPILQNPVTLTSPSKQGSVSTTTLNIDTEFVASAHDVYDVLTNEQKMCMWSRGKATMNASEGGEFSLYDGNVSGTVVSLVSRWLFY